MESVGKHHEQLLTIEEVSKILNVSVSWCYEKVRSGASTVPMPCVRVGRYVRFHLPDVLQWLRDTKGLERKK